MPQFFLRLARSRCLHGSLAIVLVLGIAAMGFARYQKQSAQDIAYRSPVRSMTFWHYDPKSTIQSRVRPAPPELLSFLNAVNILQGYRGIPKAAQVTPDIARDFDMAIREMPEAVQQLVAKRLIGIFLVRDLGSSGITDSIDGSGDAPDSGTIVIDIGVFKDRHANDWATWKERSPFKADGHNTLEATIETADRDDRAHAIQYILLHEFGHVVSIGRDVNPPWNRPVPADRTLTAYPFSHLGWRVAADQLGYVSTFDDFMPMRKDVRFYVGPRLDADQIPLVYQDLGRTGFPTLYAATNPADDFAESFANYTHVVLMHRPFAIQWQKDQHTLGTYTSCWAEQRCLDKRKILDALLAPVTP